MTETLSALLAGSLFLLVQALFQVIDQEVEIQHLTLANANTTKPCILRKGNEIHEWRCVEKDKFIEVQL